MFAKQNKEENENDVNSSGGKSLKEPSFICVIRVLNLNFYHSHSSIEKNARTPASRGEIRGEPALVKKRSPVQLVERIFPTISNSLKEGKR
jgi:hypothetical protein